MRNCLRRIVVPVSTIPLLIRVSGVVLAIVTVGNSGLAQAQAQLVQRLGEFRAAIPGIEPSNGIPDPLEERRRLVYAQLRELDQQALPALIRGLTDRDVRLRRGVALFLGVAAGR